MIMKKYLLGELKALRQLFVVGRFVITYGKKGYGNSYSIENAHLFKRRD